MIKLVIADDHRMFIDGLIALLKKEKDMEIVGEALNGNDVLKLPVLKEADVILLDINMPGMDGMETTRLLRRDFPHVKIIILTMHNTPEFISSLVREGASGYILKNTGRSELVKAIHTVYAGTCFFSEAVTETVMLNLSAKTARQNEPMELLTKREKEIIKLIAEEYSSRQIADKLFIGYQTVETHRKNIMEKIGAKNVAGLVKYALQTGLI